VRELRSGLWHWEAPHPEWTSDEPWRREVSSYAIDDGERLLLFDPLAVPDELEKRAAERTVIVVLAAPWHERSTQDLVERHGAPVYVAQPDDGSTDVAWLLANDSLESHVIAAGQRLPFGVETFPGRQPNDLVLWIEGQRAVISGDTLVDFGKGLEIHEEWLWGVPLETVVDGLRPLLDLPVELVLPTHGAPTDRAALETALATPSGS
jgi:glyoxylase-like metal-dependent hydrolase (beta-lactamase superfamily II)